MLESIGNCLIVDDLRSIRKQVSTWLTGKGFACFESSDGSQGWEFLLSNKIDLLITDIDLPGLSGFDLIKKVRENGDEPMRALPILVISSLADREIESIVKMHRGDGFIMKPLEKTSFVDAAFQTFRRSASRRVACHQETIPRVSKKLRSLSQRARRFPVSGQHRKL